ncbi:MAG: flagellar hook-length control protein FliK, partial [Burkholderiaceae bacterium]|nr:flagellar hook-length control protein FliK [Burkholderiaceae bacterium]
AAQLASNGAAHPANPALVASLLAAAGTLASQRSTLSAKLASPAGTAAADSAGRFASDSGAPGGLASAASAAPHAASAGNAAARAHSSAASLLGKAPLTPLAELPGLDAGTAQPELSGAARMLGSLLSQPNSASALPLLSKTALFGHAAPDPAQLAQTLQSSIEESGLFYESHLAAWARGERSLEQLQREPQMQSAQAAAPQGSAPEGTPPDRAAAQQINQQLLVQEQGRLQWQGESWPGQPIQWEIQRQPGPDQREGRSGSDDAPATIWRSSLRLRFAALGQLSATITMVGQQVHLQLLTDVDDSAATLRAQAPALSGSMEAAGIPLSSLSIARDDSNDG